MSIKFTPSNPDSYASAAELRLHLKTARKALRARGYRFDFGHGETEELARDCGRVADLCLYMVQACGRSYYVSIFKNLIGSMSVKLEKA